jgi:hypothetical protein
VVDATFSDGDAEATLTLDAPLGPALTALAGRLPDR